MPSEPNVYSVSRINNYISGLFTQEGIFRNVHIRGEVGTLRPWNYGIVYLNLKEGNDILPCQLSASCVQNAGFAIENGMTITLVGNIVANTTRGSYVLKANKVVNDHNVGKDKEELLKLIEELKEEGLFDPQYKKPIPRMIKCLGVVTSETGAVINDVIRVSGERNPYVNVVLAPSKVSGDNAVDEITRAIKRLEDYGAEVIIVGRGGGSDEELWVYNNRAIAEAVFNSSVPIISAVGHEINLTILDLVADLSVATPSQAAEKAVTDIFAQIDRLRVYEGRLNSLIKSKIRLNRTMVDALDGKLKAKSPRSVIERDKAYLVSLEERLRSRMSDKLKHSRHMLNIYIEKYKGLSPLEKLNQGYAYVSKNGETLSSVGGVKKDDMLSIYVRDGMVKAQVTDVEELSYE